MTDHIVNTIVVDSTTPGKEVSPTPAATSPTSRFAWIAASRKAQVAIGTVASIILARLLPKLGFTADDASSLTTALIGIGGVWIASIAYEDGQKQPPQPLSPPAPAGPVVPVLNDPANEPPTLLPGNS